MRNNDRLLYEIGELDDENVPAIVKEKKKASPVTWAAVGSFAAAAAIAGFVIFRGTGTETAPWEEYQIYSPADYKAEVIIDKPPKIPYELQNIIIYWDEIYEAKAYLRTASDIENISDKNPWSEDKELTSLPVFKNKTEDTYAGYINPVRYYTEEQLTEFLEKTVRALGITVKESDFYYMNGDTEENEELPDFLSAECSGEEYGLDKISITVYGYGYISINFNESEQGFLELPEEYAFTDPYGEDAEKTLSYLADRFKNLLQFENPVLNAYNSTAYSESVAYRIYNGSEDIAESIVNYNLANASLWIGDGKLYNIGLGNLLCMSEFIGDYPIISAEKAREALLGGSYLKRFPDSFLKGGKINEEDVKEMELIYTNAVNDEYFKPYYRFYVELDPPFPESEKTETLYGDVYVPAVEAEYILSSEDEHILTPDNSTTVLKSYPENEISLPDSSVVSKTEAVKTYRDNEMPVLEFNLGFLRYAKPVFQNSIDDPDCYNYDTLKFNNPVDIIIDDPDYFRVEAGDVLENGMTADSANYKVMWRNGEQTFVESEVVISGEAVYEGILMCRQGENYAEDVYDLVFYADPTGDTPLPAFCSSGDGTETIEAGCWGDDFALMTDCGPIFLTNTDSYIAEMEGYSEILSCDRGIKARLTLTKMIFTVKTIGDFHVGYTDAVYKDLEILE